MPLTAFQEELARLLANNRHPESYLAGGAALHLTPNTKRYSNDLDYFNDSEEILARAFSNDRATLEESGFFVDVEFSQPGYIRAIVGRGGHQTKIEWAFDSAWRFLPAVKDERVGFLLHPIDLAINKLLALVGRDEARDFVDVLHTHEHVLPLGAMCWAAAGKDPGYTPHGLLDLLKRRGTYRPEDFRRLHLTEPFDLVHGKACWLDAIASAEQFVRRRPPEEIGCLYWSVSKQVFLAPSEQDKDEDIIPHFGSPGGVLPQIMPPAHSP